MSNTISNSDDIIDSRYLIERIEELASEREALINDIAEANEALSEFDPEQGGGDEAELQQNVENAKRDLQAWDGADELGALSKLADEGENSSDDWQYGATLIRDSHFTDAMQELCSDIGDVPKDMPSYLVIDWDATAENLKQDYSSIEFDGVTYWVR